MPYKDKRKQRAFHRAWLSAKRAPLYEKLRAIKAMAGCKDYGESDPLVLQFDHVRGQKLHNITKLVTHARPWKMIKKELKKCEVVCANCHTRRTAKQFNWHKLALFGYG